MRVSDWDDKGKMTKDIFAVGYDLHHESVVQVPIDSRLSLVDARIAIVRPEIIEDESTVGHWIDEIHHALSLGRTIVVTAPKIEVRKTTSAAPYCNYDMLGLGLTGARNAEGRDIRLNDRGRRLLGSAWAGVARGVTYAAYFPPIAGWRPLAYAGDSDRLVGAEIETSTGSLVLLPMLGYRNFCMQRLGIEDWDSRVVAMLRAIDRALSPVSESEVEPEWVQSKEFDLPKLVALTEALGAIREKREALEGEEQVLREQAEGAGVVRGLLFGTGKYLEDAVNASLELLGFRAGGGGEEDIELDSVFLSEEGRFIGEVEGRDRKRIDIDKIRQLSGNIDEEIFENEDASEPAEGVLFGNAFRLVPTGERGDPFSERCRSFARRKSIALVHTPDLFGPARYLQTSDDPEYARACRQAILDGCGSAVVFPKPPECSD